MTQLYGLLGSVQQVNVQNMLGFLNLSTGLLLLASLHLGLSLGWNIGTAFAKVTKREHKDSTFHRKVVEFLKTAFQHYTFGILIMVVALTMLLGFTQYMTLFAVALLGVGIGMAYSDRKDDPPEGMTKFMLNRIRNLRKSNKNNTKTGNNTRKNN